MELKINLTNKEMTPEEYFKELQDKGTANTNFKPLDWIFRFAEMYHKKQLLLHNVNQQSEQFFALLRYTMPDQFTDIALKNIVKGFIEQSK